MLLDRTYVRVPTGHRRKVALRPGHLAAACYFTLTRAALGALAVLSLALVLVLILGRDRLEIGVDLETLRRGTDRWMAGATLYQPWQLAGPYSIHGGADGAVLYPPIVLWLIVPFRVLPTTLWWAIPMALTAGALVRLRPAPWTWPVILALAVWPATVTTYLWGNPTMWLVAAEGLGLLFGWPAILILVKPTLAPFALVGANRRSWWVALGVLIAISLPFGGLWVDWARAAIFYPTNAGWTYSLGNVPLMLIPIVAWLGCQRQRASTTSLPTPDSPYGESTIAA